MANAANTAAALKRRYATTEANLRRERLHKFAVGSLVALTPDRIVARLKDPHGGRPATRFEIMRLLPEQDRSLQYRVKDTISGQERVVAEETILINLE